MSLKHIIFCFFLSFSSILAKGWDPQTLTALKELDTRYSQTSAGAISLWGAGKRIFSKKLFKGRSKKLKLPQFFKKKTIPVYFKKKSKSDTLILVLPGFTGSHSKRNKKKTIVDDALYRYEKQKVNILSIPNFMSPMFWKRVPYYKNTFQNHLEVSYQIYLSAIEKFKLQHIKKLIIISESLGAFTALNIRKRVIEDKLMETSQIKNLLLWPPFDIKDSINHINHKVLSSKETFKQCHWYKLAPKIFYHFVWQKFPKSMTSHFQKCVDSYVYSRAFLSKAFKSLRVYQKKNKLPEAKGETLSDFINAMSPDLLNSINSNSMSQLSSWISDSDKDFIYLITSSNDFINSPKVFEDFKKAHTYILEKGGHVGYYTLLPFQEIFNDLGI